MKFSHKCRTKYLGMIYTISGSFCLILNAEGADIQPLIRLRKITAVITDLTSRLLDPDKQKIGA